MYRAKELHAAGEDARVALNEEHSYEERRISQTRIKRYKNGWNHKSWNEARLILGLNLYDLIWNHFETQNGPHQSERQRGHALLNHLKTSSYLF